MVRNYFLSAYRNLTKNWGYTLINVAGLAIGVAACLLILLYVDFEHSYENFNNKKDRIYRITLDRYNQGVLSSQTAGACAAIGPALEEHFPEIQHYVRLVKASGVFRNGDVGFKEEKAFYVSQDFFQVFSIKLIDGIDSLVLKRPFTATLSASTAKKYFKDENPIGRTLNYRGFFDVEITGIYEDMPANSHLSIDAMISFETQIARGNQRITDFGWRWDGYHTYLLFNEQTDTHAFMEKLPTFVEQQTGDWLAETNQQMIFHLQPLESIHLHSNLNMEIEPNGDNRLVRFLTLIAFFILFIAWINYINLATARSLDRAREVGVRKVLGGYRGQLMMQFLAESFLLNILAIALSALILVILIPSFENFVSKQISLSLLVQLKFWILLSAILVVGSLLSGLYPALILSGFQPSKILKGNYSKSSGGSVLRKSLVVFQFITATVLVIGTYCMFEQIKFLRDQKLGFRKEQVLAVRDAEVYDSLYFARYSVFASELRSTPGVIKASYTNQVPGETILFSAYSVRRLSDDPANTNIFNWMEIDENFLEVYDLPLLAGRNFVRESDWKKAVMINETALKSLNLTLPEDAVGEEIIFMGDTVTIKGVIADFHFESPKAAIQPLIFKFDHSYSTHYSVLLESAQAHETVARIESLFHKLFHGQPFNYFFVDEKFDRQYQTDEKFANVITLFAIVAIAITGMGLIGLASHTVTSRTVEIGIRKTLGASARDIILLLSKEFVVLVLLAFVLALPVSIYVLGEWLSSFAVRITLHWWMFIIPAGVILLVSLASIAYQAVTASATDPVKTLRNS